MRCKQTTYLNLLSTILPDHCIVCRRTLKRGPLCRACTPLDPVIINRCNRCAGEVSSHEAICELCRTLPTPFNSQNYLWSYETKVRSMIVTMKYQPSYRLAIFCARKLADFLNINQAYYDVNLIVPIPSTKTALKKRGFNQCAVIARRLSKYTSVPYTANGLLRISNPLPQASMPLSKRSRNIKGSFRGTRSTIRGKRILLIDDVSTSGATASHAASVLLDTGAQSVDFITLARAHAWDSMRFEIARGLKHFESQKRTSSCDKLGANHF